MWKYNHTDELYHYGVPGMKWGRRRNTVPLINKNVRKKLHQSPIEANVTAAKAAYKSAKKQYNKDFNKSTTLYGAWGPGSADRINKTNKSAAKVRQTQEAYKRAKLQLKKHNVNEYQKSKKTADKIYTQGDKEMAKAKALYKKTGKNAISRIINNIRGKGTAVKQYTKQFDKASKIYDKADNEWMRSEELYKKTGKSRLTRYLNNKKYAR